MLVAIPLTDDEKAAVDDGQEAIDKLLERLADTPAPGWVHSSPACLRQR